MKRRTLWIVLIGVLCSGTLAIGGALIWMRSHLDTFVKTAIETHGSAIIGAPVQVGAVHVDTAEGELTLRQFVIHNPAGFHTPHLLRVDTLRVGVDQVLHQGHGFLCWMHSLFFGASRFLQHPIPTPNYSPNGTW